MKTDLLNLPLPLPSGTVLHNRLANAAMSEETLATFRAGRMRART